MSFYFDVNAQDDGPAPVRSQKPSKAPRSTDPKQSTSVGATAQRPPARTTAPVAQSQSTTAPVKASAAPSSAAPVKPAQAPTRVPAAYFDVNAQDDVAPAPSAPTKPSAGASSFTPSGRPSAGAPSFVPSPASHAPQSHQPQGYAAQQAYVPPAVLAGDADPRGWFPLFYEGEHVPFMFQNMHTGEQHPNPSYHASFSNQSYQGHGHSHGHGHGHGHGHAQQPQQYRQSQPQQQLQQQQLHHQQSHDSQNSAYNDDDGVDDDDMARMEEYFTQMQLSASAASASADAVASSHSSSTPDCPCCLDNPYRCRNAECARAGACYCVLDTLIPPADDDLAAMDDWVPASARCACCKGYIARCSRKGDECKVVSESSGRTLCQCSKGAAFLVKA